MDQGLAAVIAGVAGMVGAVGGSLAGGIAAVRGARIGAEKTSSALLRQTQDQAAIEHRHWAREQRRLACTSIMDSYSDVTAALITCTGPLERGERPPLEDHLAVDRAMRILVPATNQLRLWGPPELSEAAGELVGRVGQAVSAMKYWDEAVGASAADVSEHQQAYRAISVGGLYGRFVQTAGEALQSPH